jgi:hypothetical protein
MTIPNTSQTDFLKDLFLKETCEHVLWLNSFRKDLQAECDYYDVYNDSDGEARQLQLRGIIKDIEMCIYTQPERAEALRNDLKLQDYWR